MKKNYKVSLIGAVVCFFMLVAQSAWSQTPDNLGTSLVNGTYTSYSTTAVGGFKQVRLQATSSAGSGSRSWEFYSCLGSCYANSWRPYSGGLTLSGVNTFISPVGGTASALYNTAFGGSTGQLPAITSGNYYTFNIGNTAGANNNMSLLETSFNPVTISSVAQSGGTYGSRTVTITTAATPASGENIYVRYSTNSYSSSTLVQATGSGTTWTATIPWQSSAVSFYVYSSNKSLSAINSDVSTYGQSAHDMATLNLNNNSGSNYSWTPATGAIIVSSTGGTGAAGAGYATFTTATTGLFAVLNGGAVHTGSVTVLITADVTTEPGTTALNNSAAWTSMNIQPSGARTVSGAATAGVPLIDFSGADNVTINGLNASGNSLTISNTTASATSGTATIRFQNDATNNTITNCTLLGSASMIVGTNGGTVWIGSGAITTGNDNITISNCNLGPAGSNLPSKAIYSNGSTSTTALGNSNITITNNNIYDYFNPTGTCAAIYTGSGCNSWSITNNRFYQTGTRTWTTGANHRVIDINNSTATAGAQGFTITGNIIGYASASQTGTYTLTGSSGSFMGINYQGITAGTISNINNNTITAISMTGVTSFGTSTSSPFTGIQILNGPANTNGNMIGSIGSTGALNFSTTTTNATDIHGIYNFSTDNWTSNNDTIGGITVTNASSATTIIHGMKANTGTSYTWTANNNIIGGTVSNSIRLSASGASCQVMGFYTINPAATFTGNIIRNLTTNVGFGPIGGSSSVIGINIGLSTPNYTISQNTIYSLSNTNTSGTAVSVIGIRFIGGSSNLIEKNFIHSLSVTSPTGGSSVSGIFVNVATAATFRNNMIRLGLDASGASITGDHGFYGIVDQGGTNNFYFNSIYIGGSGVTGSTNSAAFISSNNTTRDLRDNILVNARSNGTGTGKHYCASVVTMTGLTINYNDYFASGTGGFIGVIGAGTDQTTLTGWKGATSQDGGSISADPLFNTPTGTSSTVDLHVGVASPCEVMGTAIGSITDDFDGQTRSTLTPTDIGADAFLGTVPTITLSTNNVVAGSIQSGTTNNPIYSFGISATAANALLNGLSITTTGSYALADITNLKVWYQTSSTFNSGTATLLSTYTNAGGATTITFPSFTSQIIANGTTGYIFITADVSCAVTVGNTIAVNAVTGSNASFASGTATGTPAAGNTQTISAAVVNNVTGASAVSASNVSVAVSWTNPTGCFDEVMIIAAPASNTGTPTGNGSAYTASLTYGSGTGLGNGFVVYKGSTSPQTIAGLTFNTPYFFKIFTRYGTTWSSGVEVSATPTYCSATTSTGTTYFINGFTTTGGGPNISNSGTGFTTGGYANFTAQNVTQLQSGTVNFSVAMSSAATSGGSGIAIFVDWDQNGVFGNNANENVFTTTVYQYLSPVTGSFTVPATATLGTTRMRVKLDLNASSPTACGAISNGETEDYSFTVSTPINYTWVGGASGSPNDWNTAANWSPTGVPTGFDNATIPTTAYTCIVGAGTFAIANLTTTGTADFQLSSTSTFSINGNISLGSSVSPTFPCGSTLNIASSTAQNIPAYNYGNLNLTGGNRTFASGATTGICGTLTPGAGTLTVTGSTINFNGSGAQTIPAMSYANLSISNARSGAAITLASGTINASGTVDVSTLSGNTWVNTSNTFTYNGSSSQTVAPIGYRNLTITNTTPMTLSSTGTIGIAGTFTPGTATYTNTGSTVDFNGTGAQTINCFQYNNLNISGARTTSSITLGNTGTKIIDIAGTFNPTMTFTSGSVTTTGDTINFSSTSSQTMPAFFYGAVTNNLVGTLTNAGGDRVWASSGIIDINLKFAPSTGVNTITGSTIRYSSTAAVTWIMAPINTNIAGTSYNNLTFSGSATWQLGTGMTLTTTGDVTLSGSGTVYVCNNSTPNTMNVGGNFSQSAGTFYVSNSATLGSGGAGNLNITGNMSLTGGTLYNTYNNGTGTITVGGNVTQNGPTLYNAYGFGGTTGVINVTGSYTLTSGTLYNATYNITNYTTSGTFTAASFTQAAGNAYVSYGAGTSSSMTISGATTLNGGNFYVQNSSGSGTFTTGSLSLTGASTMYVTNSSSSPATTVTVNGNISIAGTSGIFLNSGGSGTQAAIICKGDFSATSTGTKIVDFGSTTISTNQVQIWGNFTKSGTGTFWTGSSSSAKGLVFTNSKTHTFSYSGTTSQYTQYTVDAADTLVMTTGLTLGTSTSPRSTFTLNGTLDLGNNVITAGNTTDPVFTANAGATIRTTNVSGLTAGFSGFGTTSANFSISNAVNYEFKGTATQTTNFFTAPAINTMNHLSCNNAAGIKLDKSINVNGNVIFKSGNIDLNGAKNISLGSSSSISGESCTATFTNTGTPTAGNGFVGGIFTLGANPGNVANLGANISSSTSLGTTIIERFPVKSITSINTTNNSIRRIYQILPTNAATNATISFSYCDGELNSNTESSPNMVAYYSNGGNETVTPYSFLGASAFDATANTVTYNACNLPSTGSGTFFTLANADKYCTVANGDWNTGSVWIGGFVPPAGANICINNALSVNSVDPSAAKTVTINSGGSLTVAANRTVSISSGGTFTNNSSTAAVGTGIVSFLGTGTVAGTQATTFGDVTINLGLTFSTTPTINGKLKINTGGFVNSAPIYGPNSILNYNTNGAYAVGNEWTGNSLTAGSGIPANVLLTGSTVNMPTTNRGIGGSISISQGTLNMNATSGDLYIGGNWIRVSAGGALPSFEGFFNPNCRAVFFNGTGSQQISVVSILGGPYTETFNYLVVDKPSDTLKICNTTGALTNVKISESSCSGGSLLQLNNAGILDLNGRTLTFDNIDNATNPDSWIYVNGSRKIINSGGLTSGSFAVVGSKFTNTPYYSTMSVHNNSGTGSLTIDSSVLMTIADGYVDFGLSGSTPITTINGILQVNLGGSIGSTQNPCIYGTNSILRFANTVDYQVGSSDRTWAAGATYSGNAGIPYNVEVKDAGTDLILNNSRALRGNLTITNGSLTLNTTTFSIGGNWSRTGTNSAFNPNSNKVVFNGSAAQTITCTANNNYERFYQLEINNSNGVTLAGSTNDSVTNQLILTSGKLNTGSNLVHVTNTASTALTGFSASSYVNGYLKRNVAASTSYDLPVGNSSNYQLANITFDASMTGTNDLTASFSNTVSGTTVNPSVCVVNGKKIASLLNSGIWTITPDAQPTAGSYTATLNISGATNMPSSYVNPYTTVTPAQQIAVIKRHDASSDWLGCGLSGGVDQGLGTHDNSTQTVSGSNATAVRTGLTSFSDFGIGMEQNNTWALPVELIYFNAQNRSGDAYLTWATAAEINSERFDVERSVDGTNFIKIGQVAAAGNSSRTLTYDYTDKDINALGVSVIYYRLKQVDADGRFEYTSIVSIDVAAERNIFHVLSVYPNPFTDHMGVSFYSPAQKPVKISLYDIRGALVSEEETNSSAGINVYNVTNAENLAPGMYTISISTGLENYSYKIAKQ